MATITPSKVVPSVRTDEQQLMTSADYITLEDRFGAHNYLPLDVVIHRADGVWVYDVEGKRYMDLLAGYSALNQGHCHPIVLNAMIEQARRVSLTSRAFRNDQLPLLCRDVCELTGYDLMLPMNSGAEAVETALKAARKWGNKIKEIPAEKVEIVTCSNNFHGRTISIISFSTEPQYRDGFAPFTPGFKTIPFDNPDAFCKAITPNTAAFLVEPIQGEAGIVVPKPGYLKACYEICKENNVLFIADEIQSGLGRAGKLFAHQYEDVHPDAVIVGKALSAGYYPISAVIGTHEVLGVFKPGDHGSTFGGNPLACAIARAALRVLSGEGLIERSAMLGEYFMNKLRTIQSSVIREVRGRGLWIGIELTKPARPICISLAAKGLLCKETHDYVLRVSPPLVITRTEIDWAFERIKEVLAEAGERNDEVSSE